jgi:hypothetical protein
MWQAGPTPIGSFIYGRLQQMTRFKVIDKLTYTLESQPIIYFQIIPEIPYRAQAQVVLKEGSAK